MTTQNAINNNFPNLPLAIADFGTNITSYAQGDILYSSASNVLSKLAIGDEKSKLHIEGGIPAWRPPFLFPLSYVSGRYYPFNIYPATAFGALGANSLNVSFIPIYVPRKGVFTGSAIRTNTGIAASSVTTGIYGIDGSTNRPTGSPIANTTVQYATIANTTEYLTSFSSPVTLDAGFYWHGIQPSTASVTIMGTQTVDLFSPFMLNFGMTATSVTLTTGWRTFFTQANAYSAGNLPAVGSLSETAGSPLWLIWLIAQ